MRTQLMGGTLALLFALSGLSGSVPATAAATSAPPETGTLLKAEPLKAEPYTDGKSITTLALGTRLELLQRQGGWFRVKTAKGSGWVRMLSVRRGAAARTNATGEVGGLLSLASGRAGTGTVVATTGIRGLDEEQLKAARYDEAELARIDSFVVSRAAAADFAAKAKLVAQAFDYLPAPKE